MRLIFIALFALLATTSMAEVYRSVDENGNPVFTDQPGPDAELVELEELQTIKPPPVEGFKYTPPPAEPKARYSELNIVSPQHDVAIRDNGGNVNVKVLSAPRVRGSDSLILYLDGKETIMGNTGTKSFTALDRGSHQLRAVIKNTEGRILISSPSVTFHLFRTSVN